MMIDVELSVVDGTVVVWVIVVRMEVVVTVAVLKRQAPSVN